LPVSHFVVGLTGGVGSGKSTVADLFVEQGVALVDTDMIAHQLTAAGGAAMPALIEEFGAQVVTAAGALDRPVMRQLAFADASVRQRLEAILHPMIRQAADRQCLAAVTPYVLLAVPLLVESASYRQRCDRVLVVDCPESLQINRVMARSGLSAAEVGRILGAQASRAQRLAIADDVIINAGGRGILPPRVYELHQAYLALAREKPQAKC
jgi:dephospho-CoA kinase